MPRNSQPPCVHRHKQPPQSVHPAILQSISASQPQPNHFQSVSSHLSCSLPICSRPVSIDTSSRHRQSVHQPLCSQSQPVNLSPASKIQSANQSQPSRSQLHIQSVSAIFSQSASLQSAASDSVSNFQSVQSRYSQSFTLHARCQRSLAHALHALRSHQRAAASSGGAGRSLAALAARYAALAALRRSSGPSG